VEDTKEYIKIFSSPLIFHTSPTIRRMGCWVLLVPAIVLQESALE